MTRILRQSTSVDVRIGPFCDVTDGFTPETGITLSGADEAEALRAGTATLDISGATWAAVTGADGWYTLTLSTTATNTVGELIIVVQDDSVCLPVYQTFYVVEEAIFDALFAASATGLLPANVTQFGGSNGTFSGGRPEVNTSHIAGSAVSTSSAQIGVNVVNFGGSAGTFSSGRPEVNTTHAAGTAWGSGAITAGSVATGAITNAKFAAGAIDAAAVADNAIDAGAIATGAITAAKFAAGAIDAAAIAADAIGASELASDAATEIATAVWASVTRVLTAGTNIALAKGTGVTGFNDLDAAGVRTAVGLASANLDTQIGTLATASNLATVAGYVDTEIGEIIATLGTPAGASVSADIAAVKSDSAAILSDTGTDGVVVASGSKSGYSLASDQSGVTIGTVNALGTQAKADVNAEVDTALADYDAPTKAELDTAIDALPTAVENADALLNRDMSSGTDSGSTTVRTVRQALRLNRNKVDISAGTMTVYKEDDSTASWTSAVTTDGSAEPIVSSDPAGP